MAKGSTIQGTIVPQVPDQRGVIEIHFRGEGLDSSALSKAANKLSATQGVRGNTVILKTSLPYNAERGRRDEGTTFRDRILEHLTPTKDRKPRTNKAKQVTT